MAAVFGEHNGCLYLTIFFTNIFDCVLLIAIHISFLWFIVHSITVLVSLYAIIYHELE